MGFTACRKDEDDTGQEFPQEFLYNGSRYEMSGGALMHYPSFSHTGLGENVDLLLYTKGVNLVVGQDGIPDSASGNGFILFFETFSSDSTYLPSGDYVQDTSRRAFTYTTAGIVALVNNNSDLWFDVKQADLEVVYDQGVYTLVGSGKDEADLNFNFSYQGPLTYYQDN